MTLNGVHDHVQKTPTQGLLDSPFPSTKSSSFSMSPIKSERGAQSAARGRGSRTRGGRRKPSLSRKLGFSDDSEVEEFTMDGVETKSGRKVQRPAQFNPVEQTPSRKRRATSKKFYDSRTCQVCQRGQSPATNMIVFCDGCNTPYHQLCHDPPIDNMVVTIVEAQWLCNLCDVKRVDQRVQTGLSGESINDEDKKIYLASLPLSSLVDLLFFCEKKVPSLSFYPPNIKEVVANIRGSTTDNNSRPLDASTTFLTSTTYSTSTDVLDYETLILSILTTTGQSSGMQINVIVDRLASLMKPNNRRQVKTEAQNAVQSLVHNSKVYKEGQVYKLNPATLQEPLQTLPSAGIKLPDIADDEGLWIDDNIRAFSHRLYSLPAVADGSCSSDREGLGNISMLGNVVNKIDHVVDDPATQLQH